MPIDWRHETYRRLFVLERGSFARLPALCRGLAAELLKLCDDQGHIDIGDEDPAAVVCRALGAHRGERRMIREYIPMLVADGYLERGESHLAIRNFSHAQSRAQDRAAEAAKAPEDRDEASRSQAPVNDLTTTGQRPVNDAATNGERTVNERSTNVDLSTRNHVTPSGLPSLPSVPTLPEESATRSSDAGAREPVGQSAPSIVDDLEPSETFIPPVRLAPAPPPEITPALIREVIETIEAAARGHFLADGTTDQRRVFVETLFDAKAITAKAWTRIGVALADPRSIWPTWNAVTQSNRTKITLLIGKQDALGEYPCSGLREAVQVARDRHRDAVRAAAPKPAEDPVATDDGAGVPMPDWLASSLTHAMNQPGAATDWRASPKVAHA